MRRPTWILIQNFSARWNPSSLRDDARLFLEAYRQAFFHGRTPVLCSGTARFVVPSCRWTSFGCRQPATGGRSRRFDIRSTRRFWAHHSMFGPDRVNQKMAFGWMHVCERLLVEAHHAGRAHSVEAWRDGALVGGLYGLSFGSAFLGESMFHRPPAGRDASKVALCTCHGLQEAGYTLLDAQIKNEHTERLGVVEWDRLRFEEAFEVACQMPDRMIEATPAIRRGPFG